MSLLPQFFNLLNVTEKRNSGMFSVELKREGSLSTTTIPIAKIKDVLKENSLAPKEMEWFYVKECRFKTKHQTKRKGQEDNLTLSGQMQTILRGRFDNNVFPTDPPPGLSSVDSDETYDTIIDGQKITRNKLTVISTPNTDHLLSKLSNIGTYDIDNYFGYSFFPNFMWYHSPFTFSSEFRPGVDEYKPLTDIWLRTPQNKDFVDTLSVKLSILKQELKQKNRGVIIDPQNKQMDSTIFHRPHNYYRSTPKATSLSIPKYVNTELNRTRHQIASFLQSTSNREEEEFLLRNGAYEQQMIQNQLIRTIMDTASILIGGPTFIFRMIAKAPQTYMSYLDREVRKNDAVNNYNGLEMYNLKRDFSTGNGAEYLCRIPSGETIELNFPTKEVFFTDKGKINKPESYDVVVPINKLFKSVSEFRGYCYNTGLMEKYWSIDFTVNIEPYVEMSYYKKIFNGVKYTKSL